MKKNGFVYECRCECSVIPYGVKTDLRPHVFVRKSEDESYTYIGKGLYEMQYNEKCNKIFF